MTKVKMWFDPRWQEDGSTVLGRFRRRATGDGWTPAEVDAVVWDATAGDYARLVEILLRYVEPQRTDDLAGGAAVLSPAPATGHRNAQPSRRT